MNPNQVVESPSVPQIVFKKQEPDKRKSFRNGSTTNADAFNHSIDVKSSDLPSERPPSLVKPFSKDSQLEEMPPNVSEKDIPINAIPEKHHSTSPEQLEGDEERKIMKKPLALNASLSSITPELSQAHQFAEADIHHNSGPPSTISPKSILKSADRPHLKKAEQQRVRRITFVEEDSNEPSLNWMNFERNSKSSTSPSTNPKASAKVANENVDSGLPQESLQSSVLPTKSEPETVKKADSEENGEAAQTKTHGPLESKLEKPEDETEMAQIGRESCSHDHRSSSPQSLKDCGGKELEKKEGNSFFQIALKKRKPTPLLRSPTLLAAHSGNGEPSFSTRSVNASSLPHPLLGNNSNAEENKPLAENKRSSEPQHSGVDKSQKDDKNAIGAQLKSSHILELVGNEIEVSIFITPGQFRDAKVIKSLASDEVEVTGGEKGKKAATETEKSPKGQILPLEDGVMSDSSAGSLSRQTSRTPSPALAHASTSGSQTRPWRVPSESTRRSVKKKKLLVITRRKKRNEPFNEDDPIVGMKVHTLSESNEVSLAAVSSGMLPVQHLLQQLSRRSRSAGSSRLSSAPFDGRSVSPGTRNKKLEKEAHGQTASSSRQSSVQRLPHEKAMKGDGKNTGREELSGPWVDGGIDVGEKVFNSASGEYHVQHEGIDSKSSEVEKEETHVLVVCTVTRIENGDKDSTKGEEVLALLPEKVARSLASSPRKITVGQSLTLRDAVLEILKDVPIEEHFEAEEIVVSGGRGSDSEEGQENSSGGLSPKVKTNDRTESSLPLRKDETEHDDALPATLQSQAGECPEGPKQDNGEASLDEAATQPPTCTKKKSKSDQKGLDNSECAQPVEKSKLNRQEKDAEPNEGTHTKKRKKHDRPDRKEEKSSRRSHRHRSPIDGCEEEKDLLVRRNHVFSSLREALAKLMETHSVISDDEENECGLSEEEKLLMEIAMQRRKRGKKSEKKVSKNEKKKNREPKKSAPDGDGVEVPMGNLKDVKEVPKGPLSKCISPSYDAEEDGCKESKENCPHRYEALRHGLYESKWGAPNLDTSYKSMETSFSSPAKQKDEDPKPHSAYGGNPYHSPVPKPSTFYSSRLGEEVKKDQWKSSPPSYRSKFLPNDPKSRVEIPTRSAGSHTQPEMRSSTATMQSFKSVKKEHNSSTPISSQLKEIVVKDPIATRLFAEQLKRVVSSLSPSKKM